MIDKSKTYRTRDGREVRIYATDGANERVHGAVKLKHGWTIQSWENDGKWMPKDESTCDLIEVRPRHKRTVWLAFMENGFRCYDTEIDAHANHLMPKLAIIKVELDFAEGDGL
jgi:hypothetical protein